MSATRSVAEHAAQVAALLPRTPVVLVPLAAAGGRVLAADLVATLDLPPFANSAMDGYAVRAAEVRAGGTLPVSQDIPAGPSTGKPLADGTAARIMTGAALPPGADAVIEVERTDAGTAQVRFTGTTTPGRHLRAQGSDVTAGSVVLPAGTVLAAPQLGLAAATGHRAVGVFRPLQVLILSTGTELVEPGKPLQHGQIYESNAPMLAAAFTAIGAAARVVRFVADDVPAFEQALTAALAEPFESGSGPDLVVTSGGVSAGAYEVVKDALTGRGVEFVKVRMQPGMPQGCGVLQGFSSSGTATGVPIVTLPGNPVSAYVSFEVFLRPAVLAAMGHSTIDRPRSLVPLAEGISSLAGKTQFRRGLWDRQANSVAAYGGPGSHLLGWLAGADCLFVIDEGLTELSPGDPVQVWDLTR